MKIAVFDHHLNYGGGIRFATNLLLSLSRHQDVAITFYCNKTKLTELEITELLETNGIEVTQLESLITRQPSPGFANRAFKFFMRKFGAISAEKNSQNELKIEIQNISEKFDLCYFPWPYNIENVKTKCPKVATFHDFNYKYFWGLPIYTEPALNFLNKTIPDWLTDSVPVVSTNFMAAELIRFYPFVKKVNVVHLASLNVYNDDSIDASAEPPFLFMNDLPYIVCPIHLTIHKNLANIISAASLVNSDEIKVRFVLTGKNTENIKGRSGYLGLDTSSKAAPDIVGVGYITDEQMHALLNNAKAVLNASFYEAGNGVGLDAWPMKVPVIQSNIPAFEEHIDVQGFKAFSFDPKDPTSICKAVMECIYNDELRSRNVEQSYKASKTLTWINTAEKYYSIFEETLNNFKNGN